MKDLINLKGKIHKDHIRQVITNMLSLILKKYSDIRAESLSKLQEALNDDEASSEQILDHIEEIFTHHRHIENEVENIKSLISSIDSTH